MEAFRAFAALYPETILLVDTYDTLEGVGHVIDLAREFGEAFKVRAVRLDSGDLADLAQRHGQCWTRPGCTTWRSSRAAGSTRTRSPRLVAKGAPIAGFGVGTDGGFARCSRPRHRLQALRLWRAGRLKLSTGKPVLPGRKQVFRVEEDGRAVRNVIARAEETLPGRPLLRPVMRGGRRLAEGTTDLHAARKHAQEEVARLPEHIRAIRPAKRRYPVEISEPLQAYQDECQTRTRVRRPRHSA